MHTSDPSADVFAKGGVTSPDLNGAAAHHEPKIQVMVPVLPPIEAIAPFIAQIDRTHIYSNNGPLNQRFCREFGEFITNRVEQPVSVIATTVANGTVAIDLALRALALKDRTFVVMPAYTFIATAHAVVNAGWKPYFVDVNEESLTLTPEIVEAAIRDNILPAAVVVVSPFGGPIDIPVWEAFESRTGIPVIFDMAAAVTTINHVGRQPQCVSLHGTKLLGIGEGGAVLSSDAALIDQIKQMTSFGFREGTRDSVIRGGNYRISEYAAAVGLASLRDIDRKWAALKSRADIYRNMLANSDIYFQPGYGIDWLAMSLNLILPIERTENILKNFDGQGIQWRRWWSRGCHTHPAFANAPRACLQVTERVAFRTIGVPFHELMADEDIQSVCRIVLNRD